ncbi:hypothetical protein GGF46_002342, partial [Coemansia sp. RSA 552]
VPYHAQLAAAGGIPPGIVPAGSHPQSPGGDGAASGESEVLWHGAPVFDAAHWYKKGGMNLVRAMHGEVCGEVEALTIVCSGSEDDWHYDCLALGWPSVNVIDIEYDANSADVQPDPVALQWLCMAQELALFPQAQMYRLTVSWAGCSEVFEHPLCAPLAAGLSDRLKLLDQLPPLAGDVDREMRFYKYRALFLVGVSFEMGAMSRTPQGSQAMNAYITYLLKTDIFAPAFIELADAQPQHIQEVLAAINANTHRLAYDSMRATTGSAALQSSLRRICLDMRNMASGRDGIIFCAAHFPRLESLVVRHSPDFKLPHEDPMNFGVLLSLPWSCLVELQLPFISDSYAKTLHGKCPALQFLLVLPEARYERWTAYSQTFTPDGLYALASQWPTLRQLSVRHAFRQALPAQDADPRPSSPSRSVFGSARFSTFKSRASVLPMSPEPQPATAKTTESLPGPWPWPHGAFAFQPKNRTLRVLRMPYLQLAFRAALALLVDAPQLSVLEFAPLLDDPAPQPLGIASTLRRRVSMSPSPQANAPFADSDVVYQLGALKHPLESMILHGACTTRYITSSWVQIMNVFPQLATVTFVATSQEAMLISDRIAAFCARNSAAFDVEVDDQSHMHQTCLDFTNTWSDAALLTPK